MKTKLLGLLLAVGSSAFAGTHVFFGIGVGGPRYYAPPPPPPVEYVAPVPAPYPAYGPGYGDYYYQQGPAWVGRPGYYAPRPYVGSVYVGPRYYRGHYDHDHWRR